MPINPINSTKKNTKNSAFSNESFGNDDRTNLHDQDQSTRKKFMMITDQMHKEDRFLEAELNESRSSIKSNGKKPDNASSVNPHSLKVTIKRMSHTSPTDLDTTLNNHEQYQCQKKLESRTKVDNSACTASTATYTEPDLLGPCEPGTKIVLDATVWLETQGMLIINANWRGKCFLGTLIDASKNSLGPNCPDKSISALSLMKNRSWRGNNTRGGRGGSFMRAKQDHLTNETLESLMNPGITTRSAKAAAAAATVKNPDSQGQSSESEMSTSSSVTTKGNNGDNSEQSTANSLHKRRSKRRRNNFTKGASKKLCSKEKETISDTRTQELSENNAKTKETLATTESVAPKSFFQCPNLECGKEFASQMSLRFHLQLGHPKAKKVESGVDLEKKIIPPDNKLSRINEYEFDDNDAPPQLHEETPIDDSNSKDAANHLLIKNGKLNGFNEVNQTMQMPTASPAYSDISDDEIDEDKCNSDLRNPNLKVSARLSLMTPDPSSMVNLKQISQFKSFDLSNDIERSKRTTPSSLDYYPQNGYSSNYSLSKDTG